MPVIPLSGINLMHGILAENYTGMFAVLFGEIVMLLLALVAIYYAIQEERGKAIAFIAPAVIWVVFFAFIMVYQAVKDLLYGNTIRELGLAETIECDVVMPWLSLMMLPSVAILIVVSVLWFKSERVAGQTKKKMVFATLYVFLLLFFLWKVLFGPLFTPVSTDVAKRIKSPDGTKTALLIRTNARRVHFAVQQEGLINRTLFSCGGFDFDPNVNTDYNERIIWSDDSTFIALLVDDVGWRPYVNHPVMWGYDFKNGKMCFNNNSENHGNNEIINTINSRSKKINCRNNSSGRQNKLTGQVRWDYRITKSAKRSI